MKIRQPKTATLNKRTTTTPSKPKVKKPVHKVKKQNITTRTSAVAVQNEQHRSRLAPSQQQQRNSATRISKSFLRNLMHINTGGSNSINTPSSSLLSTNPFLDNTNSNVILTTSASPFGTTRGVTNLFTPNSLSHTSQRSFHGLIGAASTNNTSNESNNRSIQQNDSNNNVISKNNFFDNIMSSNITEQTVAFNKSPRGSEQRRQQQERDNHKINNNTSGNNGINIVHTRQHVNFHNVNPNDPYNASNPAWGQYSTTAAVVPTLTSNQMNLIEKIQDGQIHEFSSTTASHQAFAGRALAGVNDMDFDADLARYGDSSMQDDELTNANKQKQQQQRTVNTATTTTAGKTNSPRYNNNNNNNSTKLNNNSSRGYGLNNNMMNGSSNGSNNGMLTNSTRFISNGTAVVNINSPSPSMRHEHQRYFATNTTPTNNKSKQQQDINNFSFTKQQQQTSNAGVMNNTNVNNASHRSVNGNVVANNNSSHQAYNIQNTTTSSNSSINSNVGTSAAAAVAAKLKDVTTATTINDHHQTILKPGASQYMSDAAPTAVATGGPKRHTICAGGVCVEVDHEDEREHYKF